MRDTKGAIAFWLCQWHLKLSFAMLSLTDPELLINSRGKAFLRIFTIFSFREILEKCLLKLGQNLLMHK
jgi:hypothetical protein